MRDGDIVICVDNLCQTKYLTLNKEYKIISIDSYDNRLEIKDDWNEYFFYHVSRFKTKRSIERIKKLKKINESR